MPPKPKLSINVDDDSRASSPTTDIEGPSSQYSTETVFSFGKKPENIDSKSIRTIFEQIFTPPPPPYITTTVDNKDEIITKLVNNSLGLVNKLFYPETPTIFNITHQPQITGDKLLIELLSNVKYLPINSSNQILSTEFNVSLDSITEKPSEPQEIQIDGKKYLCFSHSTSNGNKSKVHLFEETDYYYKSYAVPITDHPTFFIIIKEVVMQMYAVELIEEHCNGKKLKITVPKVKNLHIHFAKINEVEMILLTIQMEKLSISPTNRIAFEEFKNVIAVLDCFRRNLLFHNDTHNENIVKLTDDKIAIIDFGKSITYRFNPSTTGIRNELGLDNTSSTITKDEFDTWNKPRGERNSNKSPVFGTDTTVKSSVSVAEAMFAVNSNDYYGGINKTKKRRTKKRNSRKNTQHKKVKFIRKKNHTYKK